MSTDLKIDFSNFPDQPIGAADLVGRSFKIVRSGWLELLRFLVWPTFVYLASGALAGISLTDKIPGTTLRTIVLTLGVVLMLVSRWALTLRMYAIVSLVSGRSSTCDAALNISTTERLQLLLISSPCFVMDLFELGCIVLGQSIKNADVAGISHQTSLLAAACLEIFAVVTLLPAAWLAIVMIMLLATFLKENLSLPAACARFVSLIWRAPGYFWLYSCLMAVLAYVIIWIAGIGECLELLSMLFTGAAKNIVYCLMAFLALIIETPFIALLNAVLAIGGACFHSQLLMRLEGTDIIDRLTALPPPSTKQNPT